jgi:hypothetical protein
MARKAFRPPQMAQLQRITAEAITDPAEQAALDRLRKQQKRKASARNGKTDRGRDAATTERT